MVLAESAVKLTVLSLPVSAFTVLPFAALHRAVSASASFGNIIILLLFIYWKFHVADGQKQEDFFSGSNALNGHSMNL